jgi:ATP-dependent Lon protease
LKDKEGISRPFAMIQMGGDSNGSTLHGHNYTYVGSTWGGIVQILMDKKCMNPIIFIDELDKISKTEHGKEIVGILTHLLDTTQNDCFQDKYFSGIDMDLSKALFVLSYNDVDQIDRILLDRIHRVRFSHLSLKDKLVICNKHVLAEVYKKMGLEGMVHFEQDVLKFVIEEYTCEAGVRKLKEVLFEIVGEINLDLLKTNIINHFPINITIEDIKTKYFKDKREVQVQKIHTQPEVGIINGLWANDAGLGGTLPIQAKFYPAGEFLHLKLTGMVGDVMNESANVALSIAWNLTPKARQEEIIRLYSSAGNTKTKFECNYGIHVHFPDGSTHKNGPSGGSCLTTVLYSLLNDKKIKNEIAMTGEISLDGRITAIGGLDLKILGGIKAGVKTFIFPEENKKDHEKYVEKYKDSPVNEGISFHSVEHISNVFERVFAC